MIAQKQESKMKKKKFLRNTGTSLEINYYDNSLLEIKILTPAAFSRIFYLE